MNDTEIKSRLATKLGLVFSECGLYGVANMIYMSDHATFEKVVITFNDGSSISANVRLDSVETMLDDILKRLKRYEETGE